MPPLVSIVMAVHNGEPHLRLALDSLLAQTYAQLEIVVVDDASTDASPAILAGCDDPRLTVITNPAQRGLASSLNLGLARASGDYLARMDADDIAHPRRIELQLAYMESHPETGLLGTACRLIDDDGTVLGTARHPENDTAMRWRALFAPPLAHPSAMIRGDVWRRHGLGYDPEWPVAQDYELWPRLLKHCRGANLQAVLLDYRLHAASASSARRQEQERWALRVCEREAARFLPADMPPTLLAPLRRLLTGTRAADDPPAGFLQHSLLRLAENYVRCARLAAPERRCVRREVATTLLADAAFLRPFDAHSFAIAGYAMCRAPLTAIGAGLRLARQFCRRKLKRVG